MSTNSGFNSWNILLWISWLLWTFLLFGAVKQYGGLMNYWEWLARRELYVPFIATALWLWGATRWVVLKLKKEKQEEVKLSFLRILLLNILAPIVVSVVVYKFTGNTSITIVSVPVIGLLSASLNLG